LLVCAAFDLDLGVERRTVRGDVCAGDEAPERSSLAVVRGGALRRDLVALLRGLEEQRSGLCRRSQRPGDA
jgi:hypothetical protein